MGFFSAMNSIFQRVEGCFKGRLLLVVCTHLPLLPLGSFHIVWKHRKVTSGQNKLCVRTSALLHHPTPLSNHFKLSSSVKNESKVLPIRYNSKYRKRAKVDFGENDGFPHTGHWAKRLSERILESTLHKLTYCLHTVYCIWNLARMHHWTLYLHEHQ